MQTKVFMQEDGLATVQVIDPSDGTVTQTAVVGKGEQFTVVSTSATSPADIAVYGPEPYTEGATETPEPTETPEDEVPAGEGETPPTGEGEGTTPPAGEGEGQGTPPEGETPTTSAASEKPLYRVFADPVPEGFVPSGLAAPDGFVLFHYEGDEAGKPHTAEVGDDTDVGLYAEADDNEQPVVAAPEGEVSQPSGSGEGAEDPAA